MMEKQGAVVEEKPSRREGGDDADKGRRVSAPLPMTVPWNETYAVVTPVLNQGTAGQ